MAQYPRPAEGTWTEHYPNLGTGVVYSTIMVAMCIEIWQQPRVVNGADARPERIGEPFP
jgi:hypothetical protein